MLFNRLSQSSAFGLLAYALLPKAFFCASPTAARRVLVVGGSGALGNSVISAFLAADPSFVVLSAGTTPNPLAHHNILLGPKHSDKIAVLGCNPPLPGNLDLSRPGSTTDDSSLQLEAIVCVAGGWDGGGINGPDASPSALLRAVDGMWSKNVMTASWVASLLASSNNVYNGAEGKGHLAQDGLVVLTSAQASLGPCPDMIGYGMSKAATNHLIQSLAASTSDKCGTTVLGILPSVLDTANNRKYMPDADQSAWTPLDHVAERVVSWVGKRSILKSKGIERPRNGALVQIQTRTDAASGEKITEFNPVLP